MLPLEVDRVPNTLSTCLTICLSMGSVSVLLAYKADDYHPESPHELDEYLCYKQLKCMVCRVNSLPTIRNSLGKQNPVLKYNA